MLMIIRYIDWIIGYSEIIAIGSMVLIARDEILDDLERFASPGIDFDELFEIPLRDIEMIVDSRKIT